MLLLWFNVGFTEVVPTLSRRGEGRGERELVVLTLVSRRVHRSSTDTEYGGRGERELVVVTLV